LHHAVLFSLTGAGQLAQSTCPDGRYCYGAHLKQLGAYRPKDRNVPPQLLSISTPLKWETWAGALQSHPDQEFAAYVVEGLKEGFRIGFDYAGHTCTPAKRNMLSASQHPEVIEEYVKEECTLRRIIGPLDGRRPKAFTSAALGSFRSHINRESGGLSWICRTPVERQSTTGSAKN
jgi:hypothetical protein